MVKTRTVWFRRKNLRNFLKFEIFDINLNVFVLAIRITEKLLSVLVTPLIIHNIKLNTIYSSLFNLEVVPEACPGFFHHGQIQICRKI